MLSDPQTDALTVGEHGLDEFGDNPLLVFFTRTDGTAYVHPFPLDERPMDKRLIINEEGRIQ